MKKRKQSLSLCRPMIRSNSTIIIIAASTTTTTT